jgi:superfamily II DNA or RNA helicase
MIPGKPKYPIVIKNPVYAEMGAVLAGLIKPCVSFPSFFYRQGMYKKERVESMKSFLTKGKGGLYWIWAGLVPRIVEYCQEHEINIEVTDRSQEDLGTIYEPELPNITFRPDQSRLINSFLDNPRGILVSFTGSGKTVLGFGCLSSFDNLQIIWLCHKKDLMEQAYDEAIRFGWKSVGRVGDGYNELGRNLTIATRQSFKRLADSYGHLYDAVVVDEVHHVADMKSEYAYVLTRVLAPIRLGLTATTHPPDSEAYLTAIALIGPILNTLTINEGNELGILAKPKIKLYKMPKDHAISDLRKYSEVYNAAIVHRLARNVLIATIAKNIVANHETVLIMVNIIEHGKLILEQLKALKVEADFVHGATLGEVRSKIKHDLIDGKIKCVICSSIWSEGVNIPSLNAVINAGGGKSEIRTLQNIGRGLRKTTEKDTVWIIDIFDNTHKYLIEHFGERLCCYMDNEWL